MRQSGTADPRDDDVNASAPLAPRGPAGGRPITAPFDLALVRAPDGGLAAPGAPGVSLSADQLADLVVRAGGAGRDLRVLIADGARYATLLGALAQRLGRDVLVAPAGAELTGVPGATSGASPDETVPVDRASGSPVDWLLIQPADRATSLPGWFDLVAGLVLPRSGPVFLPLASGLVLATRDDFVDRRYAAVRLAAGHPGLVTVAVSVREGGFVLADYSGSQHVHGGQGTAVALASLPLYGGDLRVWLDWPQPRVERDRLRANLVELADTTGATVWVPQEGGHVELEPASGDLVARTGRGEVSQWLAYQPDGVGGAYAFESDVDGRLVPGGGLVTAGYPGVPLVSVPVARSDAMVEWYQHVNPEPGLFLVDLAVLDDGRIAARCADGNLLALGPLRFRELLRDAGWRGEEVVLLARVSPERLTGLDRYATGLGSGFWVARPGERVQLEDGRVRVCDEAGQPGGWRFVGPSAGVRWCSRDGWLVPLAEPGARAQLPAHITEQHIPEQHIIEQHVPEQRIPEQRISEQRGPEQRGPEQRGPEQRRPAPVAELGAPAPRPEQLQEQLPERHQPAPVAEPARPELAPIVETLRPAPAAELGWPAPAPVRAAGIPSPAAAGGVPGSASVGVPGPAAARDPATAATTVTTPAATDAMTARDTTPVTDAAMAAETPMAVDAAMAVPATGPAAASWSTVDELWSRASQSLPQEEAPNLPALARGAADVAPLERLPAPLTAGTAPRLIAAARSSKPHGVSWLAPQPLVNAEPIDLYVPSRWDPERVARDGVPCPDLFVMGRLDPVRLASERQGGYLLRVRVGPGGAVDVSASEASPPPDLHLALAPTDAYLLPVGWLDRTRLAVGYAVTADGEIADSATLDGVPLRLYCADARHGVPGLPNNVTRWPQLRLRNAATVYGLIPDRPDQPVGDWVELHRRRPPVVAGRHLVQLRVENGRAIDVADTARQLASLTSLRSRVVELRTAGVELIVPRRSYERVTVKRLFVPDGKRWRRRADVVELPLSALVRVFE